MDIELERTRDQAAPHVAPPAHDFDAMRGPQRASYNPATGTLLGHVPLVGRAGIDAALRAARAAQPAWAATLLKERAALLKRVQYQLVEQQDAIAELVSLEQGKPVPEALAIEVLSLLSTVKWLHHQGPRILGPRKLRFEQPLFLAKKARMTYEPLGVVAIISPWNYPFSIPMGQVLAALLAGNAVVLKPSPFTPLLGQKIADQLRQAGLPGGLLSVLHIEDEDAPYLTGHEAVDKVIFTGSVATGRRVMASAAARPTPVVLELGGKDAALVAPDADLKRAVAGVVWFALANTGQTCAGVERVYVHEAIFDRFVAEARQLMEGLTLDEGVRSAVDIGALSTDTQLETVVGQVEEACASGATALVGGYRPDRPGHFYAPTLLVDVTPEMRVMREETFGPVLPVVKVESMEEAIAQANDTPFGLSASVWTTNEARGWEIASQLRAGAVAINDHAFHWGEPTTPWGGVGQSGFGRTHGEAGLLEMVTPKVMSYDGRHGTLDVWWFPYDERAPSFLRNSARLLYGQGASRGWALFSLLLNRRLWERLNPVKLLRALLP